MTEEEKHQLTFVFDIDGTLTDHREVFYLNILFIRPLLMK